MWKRNSVVGLSIPFKCGSADYDNEGYEEDSKEVGPHELTLGACSSWHERSVKFPYGSELNLEGKSRKTREAGDSVGPPTA